MAIHRALGLAALQEMITDCKVCTGTSAGVVGDSIHYCDETVA